MASEGSAVPLIGCIFVSILWKEHGNNRNAQGLEVMSKHGVLVTGITVLFRHPYIIGIT